MAPERFEGNEADTRSDVWALGAVLHEMVTSQKAFQGKSYPSLVGAMWSANRNTLASVRGAWYYGEGGEKGEGGTPAS